MKVHIIMTIVAIAALLCACADERADEAEPAPSKPEYIICTEDTGVQMPDGSWEYQFGNASYRTEYRASDLFQLDENGSLSGTFPFMMYSYGWTRDRAKIEFLMGARYSASGSWEMSQVVFDYYERYGFFSFHRAGDCDLVTVTRSCVSGEQVVRIDDDAVVSLKLIELFNYALELSADPGRSVSELAELQDADSGIDLQVWPINAAGSSNGYVYDIGGVPVRTGYSAYSFCPKGGEIDIVNLDEMLTASGWRVEYDREGNWSAAPGSYLDGKEWRELPVEEDGWLKVRLDPERTTISFCYGGLCDYEVAAYVQAQEDVVYARGRALPREALEFLELVLEAAQNSDYNRTRRWFSFLNRYEESDSFDVFTKPLEPIEP